MTEGELFDYLHGRFGIGDWDEATSSVPWWKFRATEIAKLKSMLKKRHASPLQVMVAADYAAEQRRPIHATYQLFSLIPEAMAAQRRKERDQKTSRAIANVETAITEAVEAGETEWAERLMRVSTDQSPAVVKEWQDRPTVTQLSVERTCFRCQHYEFRSTGPGHCQLFDEAIDSEIFAARNCAGYEPSQEST
jgi:hypothetical protein